MSSRSQYKDLVKRKDAQIRELNNEIIRLSQANKALGSEVSYYRQKYKKEPGTKKYRLFEWLKTLYNRLFLL